MDVISHWTLRYTLPHSCYLILHFERPQAAVDRVQDLVTLVPASSSIEAGENDPMRTGEIRAPVQLEAMVHPLTAGASIPAQVRHSMYHQRKHTCCALHHLGMEQ